MPSREPSGRPHSEPGRNAALRWALAIALGLLAVEAIALWHVWNRRPAPPPPAYPTAAPAACDCAAGAGAPRPSSAAPAKRPEPASSEIEARPFTVCPREEVPARLAPLELRAGQPALWALHCGRTLHVIALRERPAQPGPERVALIDLPQPAPSETAVTTEAIAADLDGDGRRDLIVPWLTVDRSGAPGGGAVVWLRQRKEGGLQAAVRLLEAAPEAIAALALDASKGEDLALLHRQDTTNARSDELWLVQGGPAPLRVARFAAGVGVTALAALDLDLDGKDDLATLSTRESKLRLFLSRRGPFAQTAPVELAIAGARSAQVAELDDDGQRDLLIGSADGAIAIRAAAEVDLNPPQMAAASGLRDLSLMDVNADGKTDIVGYAHPELVQLIQTENFVFERKPFASLRGEGAILRVQLARIDADPRPDAVLVVLSESHVALAVVHNLEPGSVIRLTEPAPLGDAAWLEHFTSP